MLCLNCVLDFHSDHIDQAKTKIEDILDRVKNDYKNFHQKVIDQSLNISGRINRPNSEQLIKKIEEERQKKIKELEVIRGKIDSLIEREKDVSNEAQEIVNKFTVSISDSPKLKKLEESNYRI